MIWNTIIIITPLPEKKPFEEQKMSIETHTPIHNDIRYEIELKYHKEGSFVVYEMILHDLAFGKEEIIVFRFSEIKKFHEALLDNHKSKKDLIPQFPKKNSFGFWNRTNTCSKKIQERKRELQFYFTKLFNNPSMRGLREVKTLLNHVVKQRRRTRSMNFINNLQGQKREGKIKSLPKRQTYGFSRSEKDQIFSYS